MSLLHILILKIKTMEADLTALRQNTVVRKAFARQSRARVFERIEPFKNPRLLALFALLVSIPFLVPSLRMDRAVKTLLPKKKVMPMDELKKEIKKEIAQQSITDIFGNTNKFVVLVNKKSKELLLFKNNNTDLGLLEKFTASIGKVRGDKQKEGDLKTPEGFYSIVKVKPDEELTEIYGPMAFVLNYPNDLDRKGGKTGSNIWIHGTGMDRITPDTKGCVEISDRDILKLSKYINVETSVVIFPETYDILDDIKNNSLKKSRIRDILFAEAKI